MFIPEGIQQNTPEWEALKLGKPSASKASWILSSTGKVSKSLGPYVDQLAWEIVTGVREDSFKSSAMQEGIDLEDQAVATFELKHSVILEPVGVVYFDENKRFLCSPDRLCYDIERGYETKRATKRKVQTARLRVNRPDPEHWCQCQMSMLCTGWKEWWYHSHCPGLPSVEILIKRDEKYISELHLLLDNMNRTINETVREFRRWK